MKEYTSFFKNKKITLMGLGLLGRGIGDARFLAKCGADLIVTDLKTKEQLANSLKQLKKYKNIRYTLGRHELEDFGNRDMIIKAAGIPLDSPFIAEARKNHIPIEMSTALFAKFAGEAGATIVGVTGTRGKSTTTHLIYEILKKARPGKVFLGGNIKGISTIELLPKIKKGDTVVMELDSWQLQGFGEVRISPHIAVFTTFMKDHMNYYKNDMKAYFEDKANIYRYQKKGDFIIAGTQMAEKIKNTAGKKIIVDAELIPKEWKVNIPGEHNRYNIALAVAVTRAMGIADRTIKKTVESYKGVAGRLELVKTLKNGVKIYNDTTSTTPDALIVALKALGKKKNIVLIMGGADKKLAMNSIFPYLKRYTKKIICLPGTGTDILLKNKNFLGLRPATTENMADAIKKAGTFLTADDVLLLSPGFASFGLFLNEFDRGDKFLLALNHYLC